MQPATVLEPRPALLVLEDGRAFSGFRFGSLADGAGETVFNTCMTGYQEILTDPSYAGQMVVMTYPMMGNYGITPQDFESRRAYATGFVCKEVSRISSNWRHDHSLNDYLAAQNVPGIFGVETRALTLHLRRQGAKRGVIGDASVGVEALTARARGVPSMAGMDLATTVTTRGTYQWNEPSLVLNRGATRGTPGTFHVVAYDFGVKRNILRCLVDLGARVTVVPAATGAAEVLAMKPDGVLLSNGPGDPEPVAYAVASVQKLLGKVPIFGICLGHQLLGIAAGGKTYKLKFGHRGGNHPVMDVHNKRVAITSHNHGFAVDADSLPPGSVEITHIDLNDNTVEGLRLKNVPAFSVQYHPEAAPGPRDAHDLFERFAAMMRDWRGSRAQLGA